MKLIISFIGLVLIYLLFKYLRLRVQNEKFDQNHPYPLGDDWMYNYVIKNKSIRGHASSFISVEEPFII